MFRTECIKREGEFRVMEEGEGEESPSILVYNMFRRESWRREGWSPYIFVYYMFRTECIKREGG